MKRSEIFNLISNMFYECNLEPKEADIKAEKLLQKLEDSGMSPPQVLFKPSKTGSCLCTMRESCSTCGGYCNEWEPEDNV